MKGLFLLAGAIVLAMLPTNVLAQAQPPRPAVFGGSATLDGVTAANGTTVTATIDGVVAATATVIDGNYAFSITQPPGSSYAGKEITFKVGSETAAQKATWTADGGYMLNLTAVTGPPLAHSHSGASHGHSGGGGRSHAFAFTGCHSTGRYSRSYPGNRTGNTSTASNEYTFT